MPVKTSKKMLITGTYIKFKNKIKKKNYQKYCFIIPLFF